jgi:excinuclease UvrABC nuclease subunit
VRAAKRFLDGTDDRPLRDLSAKMLAAAKEMQFERAAAIRDRLAGLEWLSERLNWLRNARKENTFVYPITGPNEQTVWYMIHRGRVRGACYRPACAASAETAIQQLEEVYRSDTGPGVTPGTVDHVLLVSGWFRKRPVERDLLLTPVQAAEIGRAARRVKSIATASGRS